MRDLAGDRVSPGRIRVIFGGAVIEIQRRYVLVTKKPGFS